MIDKLSGRVALLIVGGAILLIVLVGWFALVSPQRAKATKLDGQINDTDVQLQQVTDLLQSPAAREAKSSLAAYKLTLPDTPGMSQILRQLSRYSAQAGVELDSITPGVLTAAAAGEAQPLAVTVKGHYFALQKLFKILRTRAELKGDMLVAKGRLYTLDGITFSGSQATTTAGQAGSVSAIQATFTINAYVYAPAPAAPGAAVAPSNDASSGP
jgi:hypothetical protein